MIDDVGAPQRLRGADERVRRRHCEHPINFAERPRLITATLGSIAGGADCEVSATGNQSIPATAQYFSAEAQSRAGVLRIKVLRQLEYGHCLEDAVIGNSQFGFPARGNAFDARFKVSGGAQQVTALGQQFLACNGEFGAMAATVEQQ